MNFLEALYGSQYYEIEQNGKDGNKGRLNGNVFLAAFVILFIIVIMMICLKFVTGLDKNFSQAIGKIFPVSNGKSIGRLLAIPLFAIIYFVILKTIGTERNFKRYVENFMQYPDDLKKKANRRVLVPFFALLAIVCGFAFVG